MGRQYNPQILTGQLKLSQSQIMPTTLLLTPPIFKLSYGPEYIVATLFMPSSIRTIHDHVVPEKTTTLNN